MDRRVKPSDDKLWGISRSRAEAASLAQPRGARQTAKELPQPQEDEALGLRMRKAAPDSSST